MRTPGTGGGRWRGATRRAVLRSVAAAGATGAFAGAASATGDAVETRCGPPAEGGSPRPGPAVLYEEPLLEAEPHAAVPLATAPDSGWTASPVLVSGAEAYDGGEYLYQGWAYDDYGANTTDAPLSPEPDPSNTDYGAPTGDVVYPTDEATYRDNAADLLEFRARRVDAADGGTAVAYRFTLNAMLETGVAAVGLGIDAGGDGDREWGYGLGDLGTSGLDHVLVTWGEGAELDGTALDDDRLAVDLDRNAIEVTVPLAPDGETWRHYLVVGLWDDEAEGFKRIQDRPTADQPGGAHGTSPPPVFDVGFRSHDQEPLGAPNFRGGVDYAEEFEETTESGSRGFGFGHWREHAQAKALAARDVSEFHADVDFGKLDAGVTEYRGPETGLLNRLYVSRYATGEGVEELGRPDFSGGGHGDRLAGPVQPYALYVPSEYAPGRSTRFHLHPHSLQGSYNQYAAFSPNLLRELGEELGAVVLTPEARGPGEWYHDAGEVATFEAWADVRSRYALDEDRATLGGYSMGGYATYRFASLYPDLFAKGFATVGPADENQFGSPTDEAVESRRNTLDVADNVRHVPLLMWNGSNDELVPLTGVLVHEQRLRDLGYRHELDVFPGYDHFAFAVRDQWARGRRFLDGEFLGDDTVERRPSRVTYRAKPAMRSQYGGATLEHDGAYWVSDIAVVDPESDDGGLVDVRSLATGEPQPVAENFRSLGSEPDPHTARGTRWLPPERSTAARNALEVALEGVSSVTLWVEEAAVDPAEPVRLSVESTDPATLVLAGSAGSLEVDVPAGTTETTVEFCDDGS